MAGTETPRETVGTRTEPLRPGNRVETGTGKLRIYLPNILTLIQTLILTVDVLPLVTW